MENDYTKGINNYPTTLVSAYNRLVYHKDDSKFTASNNSITGRSGLSFAQGGGRRNNNSNTNNRNSGNNNKHCSRCNRDGHDTLECYAKVKADGTVLCHYAQLGDRKLLCGKIGSNILAQPRSSIPEDYILLDSQSTIHWFANGMLLEGIKKKDVLMVVNSTGGEKHTYYLG